jgi:hypothetical protein
MDLSKQPTSQKGWVGRRCFLLLNVYTLTSPKLAVLNDSAVLGSNFPHDQIPWSKCISLRLCVFDACQPLHTTRHGVVYWL